MKNSIKLFKINQQYLDSITANEKKVLPLLIEAAKKIDKIYLLQENNLYDGANFYPHDATRQELEEAAKKNSKIFSPFTVVERSQSGKLIAIDFHQKYAKLLIPIAKLLRDASKLSENKSFKKYLEAAAIALVEGSYQKADIAWLAVKNSNFCITFGPHERYVDKLFFIKRAYQSYVGIVDRSKTDKAKVIRDILYTTIGLKPTRVIPPTIVDVQVNRTPILSGFLGRAGFTLQHLPSDAETTERYGSKIIGFLSSIDYKFEKLIFPIFQAIFEKKFKARYSKDLLRHGNYYHVLLYGIAQQLHRYQNSRSRLKELFPIFDEANSIVAGVLHSKSLILKGVIDQKELEAIMICHVCWIFSEWIISKKTNVRDPYFKGDALTLNFLMNVGALQEKEGISWPNFAKMFFEIENLSSIFTRFLEEGTYQQAQEFLSKYLSLDSFEAFDKRLATVKPF